MHLNAAEAPLRILVADDDEVTLDLYRVYLEAGAPPSLREVVCCPSAGEAVAQVEAAQREGRPFAMAFVDVRMPDGAEGLWAAERIRQIDRDVEIVMATAYCDLDPATIRSRVPPAEQLLYLQKPFHSHEIEQLVSSLAAKWFGRRQLNKSQLRVAMAQRIARFSCFEWDTLDREAWWPPELCELFGVPPDKDRGTLTELFRNVHSADLDQLRQSTDEVAAGRSAGGVGYRIVLPDGEERHFQQENIVVGSRVFSAVQDVSTHKQLERRIRRLAYFDELTELPNRSFLNKHLERVLEQAQRGSRKLALLFLDLDNFKRVNDTFGHGAGDELLREVASRLTESVRTGDCVVRRDSDEALEEEDTAIARLGGDEFIVLLSEITDSGDAARVAERILDSLGEPIAIENVEVSVGASIGIAIHPADGSDAETLLKNADSAMYHAKSEGRNTYRYYSSDLNRAAFRRLAVESELSKTLRGEQMRIAYQPVTELTGDRVVGAEALLRWEHPKYGAISPAEFIPVAEETGLIIPLGRWVLRRACEQIRDWREQGLEPLPISVNMSFRQFRDRRLVATCAEVLEEMEVAPGMLGLEFTETALMEDTTVAAEILADLKGLGVRIAMDDFGTGYSSLAYLKRLPLDRLKIDRCFVTDLTSNEDDQAIVAAVIALAHQMKLEVVAEGVETRDQADRLAAEGCDLMQGYLVSPAVSTDEFAAQFLSRLR